MRRRPYTWWPELAFAAVVVVLTFGVLFLAASL
jgi:hypothetical protein